MGLTQSSIGNPMKPTSITGVTNGTWDVTDTANKDPTTDTTKN